MITKQIYCSVIEIFYLDDRTLDNRMFGYRGNFDNRKFFCSVMEVFGYQNGKKLITEGLVIEVVLYNHKNL